MKINLSYEEVKVFKEAVNFEMPGTTFHLFKKNKHFYLEESKAKIVDFEQCCQEYLLYIGLDKNYNTTNKGEIIEKLIDKLFIR